MTHAFRSLAVTIAVALVVIFLTALPSAPSARPARFHAYVGGVSTGPGHNFIVGNEDKRDIEGLIEYLEQFFRAFVALRGSEGADSFASVRPQRVCRREADTDVKLPQGITVPPDLL